MKSMIVIDTPQTCRDCPFNVYLDSRCSSTIVCTAKQRVVTDFDEKMESYENRLSWCPLKPAPESKVSDATRKLVDVLFELDEVMK